MEQADRRREVVYVPEWMCDVVLVCAIELFVGRFGCAFDACDVSENFCVGGWWVFGPHLPEYALVFGCFGDPGGESVKAFVRHLSGWRKGEYEGDVGGVALARLAP